MNNEFDATDLEQDSAWKALQASDPAISATVPDLNNLRVSIKIESEKVVSISKRSWLTPVAVAASVALFIGSGAGYTVAKNANVTSETTTAMGVPAGGVNGLGVSAGADEKMSSGFWGGRPYLEAGSGISDSTGSRIGYTFDAKAYDRKAQLEVIADVFKIEGEISGNKTDGFFVGDQNYVNAVASTSGSSWDLSQIISWNYSNSAISPQCAGGNLPMSDTKVGTGGTLAIDPVATSEPMPTVVPEPIPTVVPEPTIEPLPEPIQTGCVTPNGELPTDESATALAKADFAALGFDINSAQWSVFDGGQMWGYSSESTSAYKSITAKVLVGGMATSQSWTMTVGPNKSIISAAGFYTNFIPTAEYNIVGAKSAIQRSQDAQWLNLAPQEIYPDGYVYPMSVERGTAVPSVTRNSKGQPILDAGLDRVTITKAEESLISWYLNDGSSILLPAYLLSEDSSSNSRQWIQLAIANEYVNFN